VDAPPPAGQPRPGAPRDKRTGGVARLRKSLRYSIAGLRHAIVHEAAVRQASGAAVVLVPVAATLPVTRLEALLLVLTLLLVVLAELLNSAIETTVDRVSLEHHPLAGRAKDMAGAAVAVAVLMAGLSWVTIAGPFALAWLGRFIA